jgi:hypothetical protein
LALISTNPAASADTNWHTAPGYRWRELNVPPAGRTFLQRLPESATGIAFTNFVSEEKELENSMRTTGAGVAAGDVDGDGWCDLYFCGMENANALYRNLGNGRFANITAEAGVACAGQYSSGTVLADIDGDGDLDLLVNSLGGGTRLFLNDGKAHFTEARDRGLVQRYGSTSMALADIDGNGTLDLYVCNYATTKIEDRPNAKFDAKTSNGKLVLTAIDGVPLTSPELTNRYFVDAEKTVRELGEPDVLYRNDGHGRFTQVPWTGGAFLNEENQPLALPPYDFGLSVMFHDIDGDGSPDIYVCNDLFPPDRIWLNDGKGTFRAMSNLAVRNTCRFAMGVDFADLNRDGYDEFFVVDMLSRQHALRKTQTVGVLPIVLPVGKIDNRPQYKRNTLFLNRGDGTYAEISQYAGLAATEWSWMPAFLDVDLDGYEDVLVTTGHWLDSLNADAVAQIMKIRTQRKLTDEEQRQLKRKYYPVLNLPNQAFRNRGDLTFEDKGREWGFDFVGISQGLCLADLDNDGDQDVVVTHLNSAAGIYRNESSAPRVSVRLRGRAPNTHGIGAKIRLVGGAAGGLEHGQSQDMICGGRFLSCDDTSRTFATGIATGAMVLTVTWRSGAVSTVRDVAPNREYEIDETSATSRPSTPSTSSTAFLDVSTLLKHSHIDAPFDDLERQPLLSRRLSQLGPGVSWFDLDGDGWEELLIGTGAGGRMAIFRNDGQGKFQPWDAPVLQQPLARDQTTLLGWRHKDGSAAVLAGAANYEASEPGGACVQEFELTKPTPGGGFPGFEVSVGPMAMADVDGDGQLDLFVGGRVEPRRYPDIPSSLLFRGTSTGFTVDEPNCRQLGLLGMASGATFSDLDGDGAADLAVACDWGPIRLFRNRSGQLEPWNPPVRLAGRTNLTLAQLKGWWNGVATGDFDGDGRLDFIGANWGHNGRYETYRERPLRVFFGEWTVKGVVDLFETYYDPALNKEVPWCAYRMAKLLPWLAERFPTQTSFATAGIADILSERAATARVLEATWLDSTLFLNRGDHFEARPLPLEAQLAPAFAACVADFDGDGNEDLFLSQNFFAVDGDTARYDAGRGLLLAGDGRGGFRVVPGQQSGLKIYGEQRGAAVADYDGDGRVDLVVTQNGAETKLYHNTSARPGLRVRLQGPPGNPSGIGAVLRLVRGEMLGPARELHAGSGYWSQDGGVQVLAAAGAAPARKLSIRWPRQAPVVLELPPNAREVTVDFNGKLIRSR